MTALCRAGRWVSDSKTAPRFIKYNMLRSLGQQEEPTPQVEQLLRFDRDFMKGNFASVFSAES